MFGAFWPGANKQVFSDALVIFACVPALWYGVETTLSLARSSVPNNAVTWIEQHVAPGTRVFAGGMSLQTLLPTAEAGERLWSEVVGPNAWLGKWAHDVAKIGYGGFRPLRVMSEDHLAQDRANRRRYYILAAPVSTNRPRYDLWIVSEGGFYDLHANEVIDRLCEEGGVYLHRGPPIPQLPAPSASWPGPASEGTNIYRVAPGSCARSRNTTPPKTSPASLRALVVGRRPHPGAEPPPRTTVRLLSLRRIANEPVPIGLVH